MADQLVLNKKHQKPNHKSETYGPKAASTHLQRQDFRMSRYMRSLDNVENNVYVVYYKGIFNMNLLFQFDANTITIEEESTWLCMPRSARVSKRHRRPSVSSFRIWRIRQKVTAKLRMGSNVYHFIGNGGNDVRPGIIQCWLPIILTITSDRLSAS